MVNFEFKRASRKCAVSGRPFEGGEEYVSLLTEQDGELVRQDIALEHFSEPDSCVGWWRSRIPEMETGTVFWAPKEVLMNYFEHLTQSQSESATTYVMAVLLVQKKYLRLLDTLSVEGKDVMQLISNSSKQRFEIPVVLIGEDEIQKIQNDLSEKLFTDVAPIEE